MVLVVATITCVAALVVILGTGFILDGWLRDDD